MSEGAVMPEMNINDLLDQIRAMLDTKIDKLETDIKGSIGELKSKIDDINNKHSESNERLTAVEAITKSCEQAKVGQGQRLGSLEQSFAVFQARQEAKEELKKENIKGTSEWVRWIPGTLIGIAAFIFALVK